MFIYGIFIVRVMIQHRFKLALFALLALQRIMRTAEKLIGVSRPTIKDNYIKR